MPSSRKKVILRKWNNEWLSGYLPPSGSLGPSQVGLLDLGGKVTFIPIQEVKWICFVRSFSGGEMNDPERLLQKTFARRPRTPGIWFRVRLQDDDQVEGLAQNDLTFLDCSGLSFTPPDSRSNTQRILLPRQSIRDIEILGVVRPGGRKSPGAPDQRDLFQP